MTQRVGVVESIVERVHMSKDIVIVLDTIRHSRRVIVGTVGEQSNILEILDNHIVG